MKTQISDFSSPVFLFFPLMWFTMSTQSDTGDDNKEEYHAMLDAQDGAPAAPAVAAAPVAAAAAIATHAAIGE